MSNQGKAGTIREWQDGGDRWIDRKSDQREGELLMAGEGQVK